MPVEQHTARIEGGPESNTDIELVRSPDYSRLLVDRVALDPVEGGQDMDGDWLYSHLLYKSAGDAPVGNFEVFHIPEGSISTVTTTIRV